MHFSEDKPIINTASVDLAPDETLEDLQRGGLRLIQARTGFRFGEDTVFLAAFAAGLVHTRKRLKVADIGAGSGASSLLLAGRLPQAYIVGIELFPRPAAVFARNILLNQLQDRVVSIQGDARDGGLLPRASQDLVISNPPYRDPRRHLSPRRRMNEPAGDERRAAVEMITLLTQDWLASAAKWLKPGGLLAFVHRPASLPDLFAAMRAERIEPIGLQAIVPSPGRAPTSLLIAGRLHGRPGSFRYAPDLLVRDASGQPTAATREIYGLPEPDAPDELDSGGAGRTKQ